MAEPLILTNVGLAKLASATPEDQLKIASVAVGDGSGGYPPLDPTMTALVNEVWRGTASAPIRDQDNDTVLIFETIIPADDGGFFIREIGLFDDDGDMIAIGQTGVVEKPTSGSGTPITMTVRVRLALANASQTNLIINDAPYIDHQATTNRSAPDAHPIESITGLRGELDSMQGELDGLGTAATHDVTTSTSDRTTGRVLRVGDFGVGTTEQINNLDTVRGTRAFGFDPNAIGAPDMTDAGSDAIGWQVDAEGQKTQFASLSSFENLLLIRNNEIGGSDSENWMPWHTVYHSGNIGRLTGLVVAFAGDTPPDGWLPCNGAAVSRTTYSRLFAVIGTTYGNGNGSTTFNLPDLRGEFIRGLDNGRGVDAGRALGSAQLDALQKHKHQFEYAVGAGDLVSGTTGIPRGTGTQDTRVTHVLDARSADETRPRNVAMNYIIKY